MDFNSNFWSAIAGAVVGGLISFVIQLVALNAAKNDRREERKEARVGLGRSMLYKLIRIASNLKHLHQHFEESYAAVDPRIHGEPWTFVLPLANHPEFVHFNEQEISLVMSLKDERLLDDLMSLDVIHNSTIELLKTYQAGRAALMEKMPAKMGQGNIGTTEFTYEETLIMRPRMVELNILVENSRERARQDFQQARDTLIALERALTTQLGFVGTLKFKEEKPSHRPPAP
ncbi:hypothetical protein V3589_29315 [Sinorhizobium fredii]|uniref:hypothetical protein n=1 Tax=Rhizobium fredii TaxID=380 RepID=UPI0030A3DAB7